MIWSPDYTVVSVVSKYNSVSVMESMECVIYG